MYVWVDDDALSGTIGIFRLDAAAYEAALTYAAKGGPCPTGKAGEIVRCLAICGAAAVASALEQELESGKYDALVVGKPWESN